MNNKMICIINAVFGVNVCASNKCTQTNNSRMQFSHLIKIMLVSVVLFSYVSQSVFGVWRGQLEW